MARTYSIKVEIESDFAMFANPQTGGDATSYPAPPYSTTKGMLEAVVFMPTAQIIPKKIHICRPVRYTKFGYNCQFSHGKKQNLLKSGGILQRRELILVSVVYQIFAEIKNVGDHALPENAQHLKGINHAHALKEIFNRKVKAGTPQSIVCLGRSECMSTYLGPLRPENGPDPSINMTLPQFLWHPFPADQTPPGETSSPGGMNARFKQNVIIKEGVLTYA